MGFKEIAVHLAVADDVFDGVFLCCSFSPRDVLDAIWNLTESVSEGPRTYSLSLSGLKQWTEYIKNVFFFFSLLA